MRVPAALIALAWIPAIALAQAAARGSAFDSLSGTFLTGARIWIQGLPAGATTDSAGRFRFDSLPAGRHVFVLEHPELDATGLTSIASVVTVSAGDTAIVVLATPSFGTVWRRLCGAAAPGADSGIVFGSVRDADVDSLLAGVTIDAAWQSLHQTGRRSVDLRQQGTSARTDARGAYQLCGVAAGVTLFVQAHAGPFHTAVTQVRASPRYLARQDFALGRPFARGDSIPVGRAALMGTVRTERGNPVPDARVAVEDVDSTVTGPDGRFVLGRLPSGTQWLLVRAIGYSPHEQAVDLRSRDTTRLDLRLAAITLVDSIQAVGTRRWASVLLDEFEQRKRNGIGGYRFDEEDLRHFNLIRAVMVGLPYTEIAGPGIEYVVRFRGPRGSFCTAVLLIDGVQAGFDQLGSLIPADLVGIEVYPRLSMVPVRYVPDARRCGIILVWTKRLRR